VDATRRDAASRGRPAAAPEHPRGGEHNDHPERAPAPPPAARSEFAPGDTVVSPYHGVGRVVERGPRTLLGAEREYLTVEIAHGRVRLMVPVDQIGGAGLRPVSSPSELRSALEILATTPTPLAGTWQTRKKDLLARLASGDLASLAELVRDYAHAAATKPLASNDRELYGRVRGLVEAELEIGLDLNSTQATSEIDRHFPPGAPPPG
jgi:CarD family transcriptional regulator